jgi:hypothetical protein
MSRLQVLMIECGACGEGDSKSKDSEFPHQYFHRFMVGVIHDDVPSGLTFAL